VRPRVPLPPLCFFSFPCATTAPNEKTNFTFRQWCFCAMASVNDFSPDVSYFADFGHLPHEDFEGDHQLENTLPHLVRSMSFTSAFSSEERAFCYVCPLSFSSPIPGYFLEWGASLWLGSGTFFFWTGSVVLKISAPPQMDKPRFLPDFP